MRRVQLALVLGSLALLAGACGDDDDTMVTVDARPPVPDSRPMVDAPPMADAPPVVTADMLGKPCSMAMPCGIDGYTCLTDMSGTGFCTIKCASVMDTTTCSNGFPTGMGTPRCALGAQGTTDLYCAVLCGDQWGMALGTACPTGNMCRDMFKPDPMNMMNLIAGQDTILDMCWP